MSITRAMGEVEGQIEGKDLQEQLGEVEDQIEGKDSCGGNSYARFVWLTKLVLLPSLQAPNGFDDCDGAKP